MLRKKQAAVSAPTDTTALASRIRGTLAELEQLAVEMQAAGVSQSYHSNDSRGYIDIFYPAAGMTVEFQTTQKF